jgi:hypothetical protein
MQRRLEQIDESIARYLSQLDSADRQGDAVPETKITRLNEKIATLLREIQRLDGLNAQMMQTADRQISIPMRARWPQAAEAPGLRLRLAPPLSLRPLLLTPDRLKLGGTELRAIK